MARPLTIVNLWFQAYIYSPRQQIAAASIGRRQGLSCVRVSSNRQSMFWI